MKLGPFLGPILGPFLKPKYGSFPDFNLAGDYSFPHIAEILLNSYTGNGSNSGPNGPFLHPNLGPYFRNEIFFIS